MEMAITLTYYDTATITAVKRFIEKTPCCESTLSYRRKAVPGLARLGYAKLL
jgi:hypothetical protein